MLVGNRHMSKDMLFIVCHFSKEIHVMYIFLYIEYGLNIEKPRILNWSGIGMEVYSEVATIRVVFPMDPEMG